MIQFNCFPGGKKNCITLSYDDGQQFDRQLVELLSRYGMKATFHLNSGNFHLPNYIGADEAKDLYRGHEIACHTVSHPFLEQMLPAGMTRQILNDRRALEAITGAPVRGMSYPYGTYNDQVLEAVRSCGIVYSRTTKATNNFNLPQNFLTWHPTCHHSQCLPLARQFIERLDAGWCSHLFYVWGHSFEFDRNNNWDLMEEFCKLTGGRDNIWYATNIEVYDYIAALRRLQTSVDERVIHNPSAIDLWFTIDGDTVHIGGGQTLTL